MEITYILIFLIIFGYFVYYIITLLIEKRLTETFTQNLSIDDSHHFLTTTILPGRIDITNLKETNKHHTDYYYVDPQSVNIEQTNLNVVNRRPSQNDKSNKTCINSENDTIVKLVQNAQPYIYDKPNIINYYDFPLYRDWRYPLQPISLKFLSNPQKFCKEFPTTYPCFIH